MTWDEAIEKAADALDAAAKEIEALRLFDYAPERAQRAARAEELRALAARLRIGE